MKREFKVDANVGAPQVAYRETITRNGSDVDYTHKKQSGGSGQFARVKLKSFRAFGESVSSGFTFEQQDRWWQRFPKSTSRVLRRA